MPTDHDILKVITIIYTDLWSWEAKNITKVDKGYRILKEYQTRKDGRTMAILRVDSDTDDQPDLVTFNEA